jgi:tRNA (mo5U34)-methyltransferase
MNELAAEIERLGPWYHTFDLPEGVNTKGFFDLRGVAPKVPIPASLAGKRCLDAAACEGFWSFELARRGADEVVSVDLPDTTEQDWQAERSQEERERGAGMANSHFYRVRELLGADQVQRADMNLYDITPEELGTFDYVFVGNILIHLADPARALRALASVMRPDAELLSLEANSFVLSALSPRIPLGQLWDIDDQPRWWTPNRAGHRRIVRAAGLEVVEQGGWQFQPFGDYFPNWPDESPKGVRQYLFWLLVRRMGSFSGWVRARPSV